MGTTKENTMTATSKAPGAVGPATAIGNEGSGSGPGTKPLQPSQEGRGQERSKERGSATRSKKQPGKRAKQGGS